MNPRVDAAALVAFASDMLQSVGMDRPKAEAVADILVQGDLLGHTTHGLQLLPLYLAEIETRQMAVSGGPEVVADRPAAVTTACGCRAGGSRSRPLLWRAPAPTRSAPAPSS